MEKGVNLPLVVIVGPTASGKTSLAIRLAREFGGEIICADSRTVYRGMDVGTAKPTKKEQQLVPHWGIDLVEPGEPFSAAQFQKYAYEKIEEIRSRGRIPFMVGGTGLYVDAVIFRFEFGNKAEPGLRSSLNNMSLKDLQNYCKENNINITGNWLNKRHLIRAIELKGISVKRQSELIGNTIVVGITTKKDILRTRIYDRAEQIFSNSVVEEATLLGEKYGWNSEAMTGNIYPLIKQFIDGELSQDELVQKFAISDIRLAKRQLTWLRRNPHILWASLEDAEQYLYTRLTATN